MTATKQAPQAPQAPKVEPKAERPKLTKEQRAALRRPNFVRLANARGNKALSAITALSKLANPGAYDYTEADVAALFGPLIEALKNAEGAFSARVKTTTKEAVSFVK